MKSKKSANKKSVYLSVLNELKSSTNLTKIRNKLNISKQNLTNHLRRMIKKELIIKRGRGWYEVKQQSKQSTNQDSKPTKDTIRGHAYVWLIPISNLKDWDKRVDILKQKDIHLKLIGAKLNTPRIKILGRKVWLCNNNIRIYDKPNNSYYGQTAKESRYKALEELRLIVVALNSKLGLNIRVSQVRFVKEHYALVENDLAIHENSLGNIVRINDENGEWLLIDDSLGKGGELENVGNKAFQTNIPMQKWWNDNKQHNFSVTPSFILEGFNKSLQVQEMHSQNIIKHQKVLDEMLITLKKIQESLENRNNKN